MDALWSWPFPLDVFFVAPLYLVAAVWWVFSTCTRNVVAFGWWWGVTYWATVWLMLGFGSAGSEHIRSARRGNDFLEFSNGRARWVGKVAVLFELQVRWDAFQAYAILGYPIAALLIVLGLLGGWSLVIGAVWIVLKAAEIRRRRLRRLAKR